MATSSLSMIQKAIAPHLSGGSKVTSPSIPAAVLDSVGSSYRYVKLSFTYDARTAMRERCKH